MRSQPERTALIRVCGTLAVAAGLMIWLITAMSGTNDPEMYVLAGLLVVLGVGLRVEAAVTGNGPDQF